VQGLRLALTWLSVLPVPVHTVDARTSRHAIGFAPVVGALIGGIAAGVLWTSIAIGAPPLLAGLLTVAVLVLATRGMHVDGLADTVDGLGCYGPPERALTVMRDGGTGPFAVVALILVIGMQVASFAELANTGNLLSVVLACAVGRAAFLLCCRKSMPSARPEGMGALVAGSQPQWLIVLWWTVLLAGGWFAVGGAGWVGPVAVVAAAGMLVVFTRHVRRRFGGITGDVLGAACELSTTLVVAICSLG
jgi:adenosylcobinamide-GDP ribazoletransferase